MKRLILFICAYLMFCVNGKAQKTKTEYFDKYWRRIDYNIGAEYYSRIQKMCLFLNKQQIKKHLSFR